MLPLAAPGNAYPSLLGNAHPSLLGKYSPSAFSHTDPCLMAGVCGQAIGPPLWPLANCSIQLCWMQYNFLDFLRCFQIQFELQKNNQGIKSLSTSVNTMFVVVVLF